MNELTAEYLSPDGALRFELWRDGQDVSLGFAGYSWHTHADLLADTFKKPEDAVADFVEALLGDCLVIAVSRVGSVVRDVWVTDDPISELDYKPDNESIEFRYWSGHLWSAN